MEANGVTHIGICVKGRDKSLAFYRDALGLKVLGDRATDPSEGGRPHNYKHRRKTRRWVSLSYGEGNSPTLTLTSHPGEQPDGRPILLDQVGVTHFSFAVKDVKGLAEDLVAKGVELGGPIEAFANGRGEIRSIYVRDPHGILVQFNTPAG